MAEDEREEDAVKKDRESAQAAKSLDKLTDHVSWRCLKRRHDHSGISSQTMEAF